MAKGLGGLKNSVSAGSPGKREFVLGSRPPDMYQQRIKPMAGQTAYGKSAGPARQAAPSIGISLPNTGFSTKNGSS